MCLQSALLPWCEAQTLAVINTGGRETAPFFDYKKCIQQTGLQETSTDLEDHWITCTMHQFHLLFCLKIPVGAHVPAPWGHHTRKSHKEIRHQHPCLAQLADQDLDLEQWINICVCIKNIHAGRERKKHHLPKLVVQSKWKICMNFIIVM